LPGPRDAVLTLAEAILTAEDALLTGKETLLAKRPLVKRTVRPERRERNALPDRHARAWVFVRGRARCERVLWDRRTRP
jgi:hypothetical protein